MLHFSEASSKIQHLKSKGNTAQLGCANCAVRFFVRLYKNFVGLLTQVKEFLCNMTETDSSKACASICAVLPKIYLRKYVKKS